jgi:uncharacterized protein YjbJ (UPF0337 family)
MRENNVQHKYQGTLEALAGRIKRAFGSLIGQERMEAEGRAQELRGQKKTERAEAGERIEGKVEQSAGKAKQATGDIVDDEKLRAEGRAKEVEGRERNELNR